MADRVDAVEQLEAALAAAMRGDRDGARLVVDLMPASELRGLLARLVSSVAHLVEVQAPGHGPLVGDFVAVVLARGGRRG